jgi:hypothetical protein
MPWRASDVTREVSHWIVLGVHELAPRRAVSERRCEGRGKACGGIEAIETRAMLRQESAKRPESRVALVCGHIPRKWSDLEPNALRRASHLVETHAHMFTGPPREPQHDRTHDEKGEE